MRSFGLKPGFIEILIHALKGVAIDWDFTFWRIFHSVENSL
jgi:hypothetical protein